MGYVNKTYLSTQFKNFADKIAKVFSKIGHTHLKSDITDFPTSMPANGGNAATVGGHTVGVNVPSNAKFTDTTYSKLSEFTDDVGYVKNTDARLTDARNAKDVYAWAKASTKPTYTASEVGLGNVGNFKAVSTVASQGLSNTEKSNARANIGAGTSSFSGSYNDLKNKPTIPTVGNGTVTIKQAGASKGTFTMNQSGNTTIELTDNNTWRGIQNNLTSNSTTDSLSAAQGKVLKGLVDGKAASSHTHTKSQITDFPTSLPASDVYSWAKASKKPSYTKTEVGLGNVDNTADSAKTVYAAQRMIIQENRIDGNLESFEFNPEYSREHLGTSSFDIVGYDKENKVMTYGNSIDAIDTRYASTTFKSNDSTTGDSTPPSLLASGETHASIFSKVSTIFKNVRWLLSKMGTTDISSIGNGTVTGALSTLNSNMIGLKKTQLLSRTLSPLASGEISLNDNLSNYLYYEIIYSPDFQSDTRRSSGLIPTTSPTEVISVTPNAAGKGVLIFTRSYTPNGNKMLVGVGYYYAALNSKGENYSGCNIVTRVYGYK